MIWQLLGLCLGTGTCAFFWGYTYGQEHAQQDLANTIKRISAETVEQSMLKDGWVKP